MKTIDLYGGFQTVVDDADYDLISKYTWSVWINSKRTPYAKSLINGKTVYLSRLLMGLISGDKRRVDHINRNTLDNRRDNLRVCTNSENLCNAVGRDGTSIYKGVSWHPQLNRWRARIRKDNKIKSLGCFHSEVEAARAFDAAAFELHGEFARTNF